MTPNVAALVDKAKALYQDKLAYFAQNHKPPAFVVAAPGRVNLIGEHTDYTGGFVLPLAINLSTVVYGTGFVKVVAQAKTPTSIRLRMYSDQSPKGLVEERRLTGFYPPPEKPNPDDTDSPGITWSDYVVGTIVQYMPDLPTEGCHIDLVMAFASDIPLGAGLSSSASLEMATAVFLENFLHDYAYSSASLVPDGTLNSSKSKIMLEVSAEDEEKQTKIERALRCQKAENEWAHSACGIMDQMISSCAVEGHLLLLDCRDLEYTHVPLKQTNTTNPPVLVITNSNVEHKLAGEDSQYATRRNQCQDALLAMQSIPLYHVLSLRDATLQDVKDGHDKGKMDDVAYQRAKHVVTENARTKEAKVALRLGTWDRLGELMNASHDSLRDDFQVSCDEVDFLVETARGCDGVFGSRMTGGGFGGCIVSLVLKDSADALMETLSTGYSEKYGADKTCPSIIVEKPGPGARVLAIDMDCKPESDFYKSLSPKKKNSKDEEE
jgi:galactokinase